MTGQPSQQEQDFDAMVTETIMLSDGDERHTAVVAALWVIELMQMASIVDMTLLEKVRLLLRSAL